MRRKNILPIDLSNILKPYDRKWVALSFDHKRVLAAGNTVREVREKTTKQNEKYLLLKLPPFNISYVPSFSL